MGKTAGCATGLAASPDIAPIWLVPFRRIDLVFNQDNLAVGQPNADIDNTVGLELCLAPDVGALSRGPVELPIKEFQKGGQKQVSLVVPFRGIQQERHQVWRALIRYAAHRRTQKH